MRLTAPAPRARWPLAPLVVLWLGGCAALPHFPRARLTTPAGAHVEQSGPADSPATVTTDETTVTVTGAPAPAAVAPRDPSIAAPPRPVTRDAAGMASPRADTPAAPGVTITTRHETATAPRARAAETGASGRRAPPEPASGSAGVLKWYLLAALAALLVAGLLAWSQHYLAAVKFALGAVALPVLGRFFSSAMAMTVAGILFALGAGLWLAWRILAKRYKLTPAE